MQNQTKPVFLLTQVLLATYWPQVEPLLASAPIAEEYPPDALLQMALAGQVTLLAIIKETEDGPTVELVVVIMGIPSETNPVMNIVTVAGRNLRQHIRDYWEYFQGWCVMNGARAIDAYVPDRMERFVEKLGLKRETVHVRLRL